VEYCLKIAHLSMEKGRLIAFDYGTRRLGIAVTDPLQLIATPLTTIHPKEIVAWLAGYLAHEQVVAFVVGDPRQLDNSPSAISPRVESFIAVIKKHYPQMPMHRVPERNTSQVAARSLIESGARLAERRNKGNIDMISATLILQIYLEGLI